MKPADLFAAVALVCLTFALGFALTGYDLTTVAAFGLAAVTNGLLAIAAAITSRRTTP